MFLAGGGSVKVFLRTACCCQKRARKMLMKLTPGRKINEIHLNFKLTNYFSVKLAKMKSSKCHSIEEKPFKIDILDIE